MFLEWFQSVNIQIIMKRQGKQAKICCDVTKKTFNSFLSPFELFYLCNMKKKLRCIIGFLLIVLYLGYYGGTTLFFHTHQTPYGTIIHSHPFKTAHSHTIPAYITLSILSTVLFLSATIAFFETFLYKIRIVGTDKYYRDYSSNSKHSNLRGPPQLQ